MTGRDVCQYGTNGPERFLETQMGEKKLVKKTQFRSAFGPTLFAWRGLLPPSPPEYNLRTVSGWKGGRQDVWGHRSDAIEYMLRC